MSLRIATKEQVLALVEFIPESGVFTLDDLYKVTLDINAQSEIFAALKDFGNGLSICEWDEDKFYFKLNETLYQPYDKESSKYDLHQAIMQALEAKEFCILNNLTPEQYLDPHKMEKILNDRTNQEKAEQEFEKVNSYGVWIFLLAIAAIIAFIVMQT
ncbi:hypothetical protein [Thorsellia anophelis]|uniref:Uncharacterized protein n=1 Tax=Thorsellia anophelis DSM 18579 TaxID=1123402 RepID=A0A1I0D7K9_9GAMM|nr:hypothetical protein [Thorsellia anophelis]SET28051.1 hypothetical protein SAMN02583745_01878 [Thorsellia anophelis DSM 18579]